MGKRRAQKGPNWPSPILAPTELQGGSRDNLSKSEGWAIRRPELSFESSPTHVIIGTPAEVTEHARGTTPTRRQCSVTVDGLPR
jgi:hypothetical protein